jgi:sec-independent protein translocase protein TatB
MFDIAPSELLLVAVVALLVIGPKDLPLALRTAGRWMGKVRRMSNHFRAGVETMIREAELAEIEKEWRERNARIMAEHPDAEMLDATIPQSDGDAAKEPLNPALPAEASAEAAAARGAAAHSPTNAAAADDTAKPPAKPLRKRRG